MINREIYVQGIELEGLNGSYHPYGNRRLRPINIFPLEGGKYEVSNHNNSISLNTHDYFALNELEQLFRRPGPYYYKNHYKKVIAKSTIRFELLKLLNTMPPKGYTVRYPFSVTAYSPVLGEKIILDGTVGFEWEILIISKDDRPNGEKFKYFNKIYVRPRSGKSGAQWLEEKIVENGALIQRSGMFDCYEESLVHVPSSNSLLASYL